LVAKDWVLWPRIGFGGQGLGLVTMKWVFSGQGSVLWPRIGFGGQGSDFVVKDRV
jgi:hypothetical protein